MTEYQPEYPELDKECAAQVIISVLPRDTLDKESATQVIISVLSPRDTLDKESAAQVPGSVQDILYLTAVFNSCLNPLIYGVYYYTDNRTLGGRGLARYQERERGLKAKNIQFFKNIFTEVSICNSINFQTNSFTL